MRNLAQFSDEMLLEGLRRDEEAAFDEIYYRYWALLCGIAYKRVQSRDVVEEMVQELFTTFWLNRRKLQVHTSLKAYLSASIRYMVLRYFQQEMAMQTYRNHMQAASTPVDSSTEAIIQARDLSAHVEQALTQLPQKCRQVYELSRKEYKSNREIAETLNISEKTVENQLTKALRVLRLNLKDIVAFFF